MVGSSRRRTLRRQQQSNGGAAHRRRPPTKPQPAPGDVGINIVDRLPPELLAEIHSHLGDADFLKRLAFASVCGASGHMFKQEGPCLVLAGGTEEEKANVFSLAARRAAAVRAPDPAMRRHVVLGSSGGWLVTADALGTLRMANPVTGAQADLPSITKGSIPFLGGGSWRFCLDVSAFRRIRFGGKPGPGEIDEYYWGHTPPRTYTLAAEHMRIFFYRKVVISASGGAPPGGYAAMLILNGTFGAPAFATSEDPTWRLAPCRDGVEDAIHHRGQFYSISPSGSVEAWARDGDTGEFTSTKFAAGDGYSGGGGRRYLAAAPDGRLMAVLKHVAQGSVSFTVMVLDEARRQWEEAADIGGYALFVGVNASLCVPALEYRGIRPSCVYFTDDDVRGAWLCHEGRATTYPSYREGWHWHDELRDVGVYSMKHGRVEQIVGLGKHPRWPPPAWFTPSFL